MTIAKDFVNLVKEISNYLKIPSIKEIFIPPSTSKSKKANFGAILLEDGSIGIVYIKLNPGIREIGDTYDLSKYIGVNALVLANEFNSSSEFEKTLGMAAINAISQFFFKKTQFNFDFTTDSLGLLNLKSGDIVGMIGFFPPLVQQIERLSLKLIIIEKNPNLLKKSEKWEVSLDPSKLSECNKILCTSTTILNDSIDDILKHINKAEKFSVIGPTAGFLPDPLFDRGVNVVGGTYIHDSNLFMKLIKNNEGWGPSTKKYCITKESYKDFNTFLKTLKQ